jgi:hypothetical protein
MPSKDRRRNRRKHQATGPITPEGKAISSQNATTHGLTSQNPGRGTTEYERVRAAYQREFNPQSEHGKFLVDMMASAKWRIDRIDRIEAAALDLLLDDAPAELTVYHKLAKGMGDPDRIADKLLRHRSAAERQYRKAHQELTSTRDSVQNERPCSAPAIPAQASHPNPPMSAQVTPVPHRT